MSHAPEADELRDSSRPTSMASRRRLLYGLALAGVGLSASGQSVLAREGPSLEIDVRSPVDPDDPGLVPVKVERTSGFDPTTEALRYRFSIGRPGSTGGESGVRPVHHIECESGLLLFFRASEAGYTGGRARGVLRWQRDEHTDSWLTGVDGLDT
ncbi:DcrB/PsbP domain-containing protein [Natronobiforma cellulositropha]|uniref:hypothetical protein n=1 Tax=Natronobiforma cellulositropha TaxID=1679076 RepID=UPI0021D59474|nr:hypothetical protein [Natronobiforma cellulositropha]